MRLMQLLPPDARVEINSVADEIMKHDPSFTWHDPWCVAAVVTLWTVREICKIRSSLKWARPSRCVACGRSCLGNPSISSVSTLTGTHTVLVCAFCGARHPVAG